LQTGWMPRNAAAKLPSPQPISTTLLAPAAANASMIWLTLLVSWLMP
jgi:hypothetical protein